MTDNHILAPKVDLIMAMDDLRLRGCNHSADLLKKALFTVPESVVPVNWLAVEARISEFVNEYEMVGEDEQGRDGHYTPNESERALILDAMHGVLADDELMALLRPAARVAAQAQPYSLDLDPAGIRALTADAISGALALGFQGVNPPPNNEHWLAPFWEISRESAVQAQQPVSGADRLPVKGDPWSGWACQHPGKLPRLYGDKAIAELNHHPEEGDRLFQLAECTQQDADKVDAALAEMVHAMFRSGNSVPVTRITIDRKQYDAAIDAARKEQA